MAGVNKEDLTVDVGNVTSISRSVWDTEFAAVEL